MKVFDIVTDKKFLHSSCEEVALPLGKEDKALLLDMVEYLKTSQDDELSEKYNIRPGVGLAANQIGIKKHISQDTQNLLKYSENLFYFAF